jgi:hypothetical protein
VWVVWVWAWAWCGSSSGVAGCWRRPCGVAGGTDPAGAAGAAALAPAAVAAAAKQAAAGGGRRQTRQWQQGRRRGRRRGSQQGRRRGRRRAHARFLASWLSAALVMAYSVPDLRASRGKRQRAGRWRSAAQPAPAGSCTGALGARCAQPGTHARALLHRAPHRRGPARHRRVEHHAGAAGRRAEQRVAGLAQRVARLQVGAHDEGEVLGAVVDCGLAHVGAHLRGDEAAAGGARQ